MRHSLKDMEYVYQVYQERSFSRAAARLYISQPSLSAAVRRVEQELQTPLFDRSTSPVGLTAAGRYYVASVEKILALTNEMDEYFHVREATGRTRLVIGSSSFFCAHILPPLVAGFQQRYPQVSVTLCEDGGPALTEKLEAGQVDLVLEVEELDQSRFQSLVWDHESVLLAVPAANPCNQALAPYCHSAAELQAGVNKGPISLHAFRDQRFILLEQGNDLYQRAMAMCRNAGFQPQVPLYVSQMTTACALAGAGRGLTFLRQPLAAWLEDRQRLCFYRLDDPLADRRVLLSHVRERPLTPLQRRFADYLATRRLSGPEPETP